MALPGIAIGGGITIGGGIDIGAKPVPSLVMNLDASTLSANPTSWTDSVNGLTFTLFGSPTYSASNGGVLQFATASSQYAQSPNPSFGTLTKFTVETWHYYTGTNTGSSPCIITEVFTGGSINYFLGSGTASGVQAGFFNGQFHATSGYTPTAGNWYQFVGTYDGSTVKLYVNNSLTYSTSYVGTPSSSGNGVRLMRRWDTADYWGGSLGIVNIYNYDIGASGVTASWNTNRSRFGL
jgi:Concanavalin A-like lectin/glucanases superfamily